MSKPTKEKFVSEFMDELLGMATRIRPAEDREWGIFVRDRERRIKDMLERMYDMMDGVQDTPAKANGVFPATSSRPVFPPAASPKPVAPAATNGRPSQQKEGPP